MCQSFKNEFDKNRIKEVIVLNFFNREMMNCLKSGFIERKSLLTQSIAPFTVHTCCIQQILLGSTGKRTISFNSYICNNMQKTFQPM